MLDRASILAIDDRKLVKLAIPEWGMDVYIRPMSGAERDSFEGEMIGQANRIANLRGRMAVRVVCDQDGKRLFTDGDAAALGEKSAAALDRIFMASQKLNHIGTDEVASVGEASAGDQNGSSGTGSP